MPSPLEDCEHDVFALSLYLPLKRVTFSFKNRLVGIHFREYSLCFMMMRIVDLCTVPLESILNNCYYLFFFFFFFFSYTSTV